MWSEDLLFFVDRLLTNNKSFRQCVALGDGIYLAGMDKRLNTAGRSISGLPFSYWNLLNENMHSSYIVQVLRNAIASMLMKGVSCPRLALMLTIPIWHGVLNTYC